jgi:hypothetical protein
VRTLVCMLLLEWMEKRTVRACNPIYSLSLTFIHMFYVSIDWTSKVVYYRERFLQVVDGETSLNDQRYVLLA